ncbi:MAG: type II toxin-antitoxin system Phd/YefM family antitoxin [Bifidobacteriaceae bacterium]|jgi:antitoxin YefM|nr:type II toxin-antitoxin system Phd/YefM family antitoxin [Bifidobacteriaceae bacterium]
MAAMTATHARKEFFRLIQQVNDDHAPVEIVSKHGNAVIVAAEDWEAMNTTAHLFSTPANAERLLRSLARAQQGEVEEHELLDT